MTVRSVYEIGYTGSEASVAFHGRQMPGGTVVVCCHGLLAGATQFQGTEGGVVRELADRYEVTGAAADLGGAATWGNDLALDALDALVDHMASTYSTRSTVVAFYGLSMGALLALNYAMRDPSKVAALALVAPVVSLEGIHDRDPNGAAASIETAYTNEAGYLAALPTHDPSTAANLVTLGQLAARTRLWYSTDDTVVDPSEVLTYAGATGATLDSMGAIGHASTAIAQRTAAQWLDGFCS